MKKMKSVDSLAAPEDWGDAGSESASWLERARLKNRTTHELICWLMYALVVITPAIYSTAFESAFTLPKLTFMRLVTLAIVGIWAVQAMVQKKIYYRKSPLTKWLLGYGLVLVATTVFSHYFWVSLFGEQGRFLGLFTWLNLLFLCGVAFTFFQSKKEIRRYVMVSVWTAVALAVYGILQFKGLVGAEGWTFDPTLRVFGTMGHSNHFGGYLAFHVLLLMGLFATEKRRGFQVGYAVASLPMFVAILATASRAAFFSLVIAMGVFGVGMLWFHREWVRKSRRKIGGALAGMLVLLLIFQGPLITRLQQLSLTQRTLGTIEFIQSGNVPDRVSWWFSALAMVREHPVLGYGLATFMDVYNMYRRTDYRVPGDEQDVFTPESTHMEYLNVAATQGVVGLIFYLGLIVCWLVLVMKTIRNKENLLYVRITALSFLGAGLIYFIQAMMSFGVVGTLLPLYLMVGASAALYHITSDPRSQKDQFGVIEVEGMKSVGVGVVLGVMMVLCLWFTGRQVSAEWHLKKGQTFRAEQEVAKMLEHYEKATMAMPWMYVYWNAYGEGAFDFGTYDQVDIEILEALLEKSISGYENAYRLVQTQPYIPANLGLAYLAYSEVLEAKGAKIQAQSAREEGMNTYEEAVEVAVNNPRFVSTWAKLLLSVGREEEAREAWLQVLAIREPYQDTYYQLALLATTRKDYDEAREYIQKALQQMPGDEKVKALLQRIHEETK